MANPVLEALREQVEKTTAVEASAAALINGINDRLKEAVDKALANGATAEELAPVQTVVDSLTSSSDSLSAAVAANTPGSTDPTPTAAPKAAKKK